MTLWSVPGSQVALVIGVYKIILTACYCYLSGFVTIKYLYFTGFSLKSSTDAALKKLAPRVGAKVKSRGGRFLC